MSKNHGKLCKILQRIAAKSTIFLKSLQHKVWLSTKNHYRKSELWLCKKNCEHREMIEKKKSICNVSFVKIFCALGWKIGARLLLQCKKKNYVEWEETLKVIEKIFRGKKKINTMLSWNRILFTVVGKWPQKTSQPTSSLIWI